jgi:hypothetical protein
LNINKYFLIIKDIGSLAVRMPSFMLIDEEFKVESSKCLLAVTKAAPRRGYYAQ